MNQPTDLITIKEAAELLPLKIRRIRQLAQAGKIEAVKLGRDWLISRESVEAYRAARATRKAERSGDDGS